jgi:hypothetical protein
MKSVPQTHEYVKFDPNKKYNIDEAIKSARINNTIGAKYTALKFYTYAEHFRGVRRVPHVYFERGRLLESLTDDLFVYFRECKPVFVDLLARAERDYRKWCKTEKDKRKKTKKKKCAIFGTLYYKQGLLRNDPSKIALAEEFFRVGGDVRARALIYWTHYRLLGGGGGVRIKKRLWEKLEYLVYHALLLKGETGSETGKGLLWFMISEFLLHKIALYGGGYETLLLWYDTHKRCISAFNRYLSKENPMDLEVLYKRALAVELFKKRKKEKK